MPDVGIALMVILHSRRMIYIHLHKTGGETIENTLAQIEQPGDVILDANHPDVSRMYDEQFGLTKHSSALEVVHSLGTDVWNNCITWTTVRNPYERMASFYSYLAAITEPELALIGYPLSASPEAQQSWIDSPNYPMRDQWAFAGVRAYLATRASRTPFSDFLRHPLLATHEPAYLSQFSRLCNADGNALLVSRAVKIESLTGLWPQICRDMDLPPIELQNRNKTPARWRYTVTDLFSHRADVELVNTIYADDFRWLGYEMMATNPVPGVYAVPDHQQQIGRRLLAARCSTQPPGRCDVTNVTEYPKASAKDLTGRFREIVADPINLLIERDHRAGLVEGGLVWLHNGVRVPIEGQDSYYGEFSKILVINRGVHEPLEEYVFQEVLRKMPNTPCMLELGSYWAHYSMWMKCQYPEAQVIMVESVPENLEVGRRNFARHGYNGTFIRALVGKGQFEVDGWLRGSGCPRINILHVDIQGSELEMMQGCADAFGHDLIDIAFISTHGQTIHDAVASKLTASGMRIEISSGFDLDTTSFDGFLFAVRTGLPPLFPGFKVLGRCDLMHVSPAEVVSYLATVTRSAVSASASL